MSKTYLTAWCVGTMLGIWPALSPANVQKAATDPQSSGLQEVVVTAERRREPLQKAPAAITAITGSTMVAMGLHQLPDVSYFIPSASFDIENRVVHVYVRGVGTPIATAYNSEPVSTNFNGINLPMYVIALAMFDNSRIEVLPGPQGTLYGRNAIGGAVNIHANEPTHTYSADALLEIGNYQHTLLTAVLNGPINHDLAIRLAVNTISHAAYLSNDTDTQNSQSVRLSALYTPNKNLSVLLWGMYYKDNNKMAAISWYPYLDQKDPWHQPTFAPISAFFFPPNGFNWSNAQGFEKATMFGGRARWDMGWATLTFLPSYLTASFGASPRELAGLPANVSAVLSQTTDELRLASNGTGRLSWLGGLYWYRYMNDYSGILEPNLGGTVIPNVQEGYSGYGQVTYKATAKLRFIAGGRYSSDQEDAMNAAYVYPIPPNFGEGLGFYNAHPKWRHFDWKVGAQADVAPHSLLYANIQTGYGPGFYQDTPPNAGARLLAQTMVGYTVGIKNTFLNNHLMLNDEAYYYDYTNFVLNTVEQGGASLQSFNVPKVRIYGDQLDFAYKFGGGSTQVGGSVGLLSAKITKFNPGIDYSGYELPYAPEATVSLNAQHSWNLPNEASVVLSVHTRYEDGYWGVFSHTSGLWQPAFTKTDANLTYFSADGRWDVGLWGKNLENTATFAAAGETGLPPPTPAAMAYLNPPRTFGVRFHVHFEM